MNKFVKRIVATATAAALSLSAVAITAAAEPVNDANWETYFTRTNYTGFYTGQKGACFMFYSPNGYDMYCNGFNCTKDGADGEVNIKCTDSNASMADVTIKGRGHERLHVNVTNPINGIHFEFAAYTDVLGNVVSADGRIHTINI